MIFLINFSYYYTMKNNINISLIFLLIYDINKNEI